MSYIEKSTCFPHFSVLTDLKIHESVRGFATHASHIEFQGKFWDLKRCKKHPETGENLFLGLIITIGMRPKACTVYSTNVYICIYWYRCIYTGGKWSFDSSHKKTDKCKQPFKRNVTITLSLYKNIIRSSTPWKGKSAFHPSGSSPMLLPQFPHARSQPTNPHPCYRCSRFRKTKMPRYPFSEAISEAKARESSCQNRRLCGGVFLKGPFPPPKKNSHPPESSPRFPMFFFGFGCKRYKNNWCFHHAFPALGVSPFPPLFRKISLSFLKILMSLFQSQIYQQDSIQ